jgi:phosphatidylserine/phosphatidylglycerophosphate/cardiolipin synthase-like enzyme
MRSLTKFIALAALAASALACGGPAPAAGPPAGTAFRLWQDASIFTPIADLMRSAGPAAPVRAEMYEFGRADLGGDLLSAKRRGADVRVIVDRTVPESARMLAALVSAGLAVRAYPVDERAHQIDHVKLLVVGDRAVVGGMNWGTRSAANHDYALVTSVPAVLARLRAIFDQDWSFTDGRPSATPADAGAAVAQTAPGEEIRARLLREVEGAGSTIAAEVFVMTDPSLISALAAARRRGVRVRIILDPNQPSNARTYRLLGAAQVERRWYPVPPHTLLHAKAGLFDGRRLLVGSANWSHAGLSVNHELDLTTDDPGAAAGFAARFERDWSASSP